MKNRSSNNILCVLRDTVFLFLLLWLINPQAKFGQYYNWNIYGLALAVWIFLALVCEKRLFVNALFQNNMFLIWLWPLYLMMASLVGHAEFSIKQFTTPMIFVFFIYYVGVKNKVFLKFDLVVSAIYIFSITINTYTQNQINPEISRILAHGDVTETWVLSSPFLADFRFVYALVSLAVVLIGVYKAAAMKKIIRFLFLVCWLWLIILFSIVEYTIALIISVALGVWIISMLDRNNVNNSRGRYVVSVKSLCAGTLLLVGALVFSLNYVNILEYLKENVSGQNFRIKIDALIKSSKSSEGVMTLERAQLYMLSFNTFFSGIVNFIFGVGSSAGSDLVGQHSSIFDIFARYGIIGGSVWATQLVVVKKNICCKMKGTGISLFKCVMTAFLIELLLNPVYLDMILLFFFFIAPMLCYLFCEEKDRGIIIYSLE